MIFPVLLIYKNIDEIIYIGSESDWNNSVDLSKHPHPKSSYLLDLNGIKYSINFIDKQNKYKMLKESISLHFFSDLVKGHLFYMSQTCVSKIVLQSFDEGFNIIKSYQE